MPQACICKSSIAQNSVLLTDTPHAGPDPARVAHGHWQPWTVVRVAFSAKRHIQLVLRALDEHLKTAAPPDSAAACPEASFDARLALPGSGQLALKSIVTLCH